jgi:hypothetical protein
MTGNEKKRALLGMPFGTATARLRKTLLFVMAKRLGENICYRCSKEITTEVDFSIEHKKAWALQPDPIKAFFDLGNIAFSHIACNVGAASRPYQKYESDTERERVRAKVRRENPDLHARHLEYKRAAYARNRAR